MITVPKCDMTCLDGEWLRAKQDAMDMKGTGDSQRQEDREGLVGNIWGGPNDSVMGDTPNKVQVPKRSM